MFCLIGLGISWKDLSLKALEAVKNSEEVYLEAYTSSSDFSISELESLLKKKIKVLYREEVEQSRKFIDAANSKNISLLVYGDPLSATTHFEMLQELKEKKIPFKIIHSSSILSAIGETGLSLYKFGKTASIPFWQKNFRPESFFDLFLENQKIKAHTLFLLDLDPKSGKFMTPAEALETLLKIAKSRKSKAITEKTLCIACSGLGTEIAEITAAPAKDLLKKKYMRIPHCLIIPSKLSDSEKEFLNY